jgi:hypothetical protein
MTREQKDSGEFMRPKKTLDSEDFFRMYLQTQCDKSRVFIECRENKTPKLWADSISFMQTANVQILFCRK